MSRRLLILTVAFTGLAAVAMAQQPLKLQIADGRVSLHAQNVPVRTILAEWSRLGGAKIVNGERVAGAPVTLDLENIPERQALDILLRGVSGYMLAARDAGSSGASMFDRIMILPTSVAPRNPPAAASTVPVLANPTAGIIRPITPRLPVPDAADADDTDVAVDNNDGVPIARPVSVLPRPTAVVGTPAFPPPPIANVDDAPAPQPGVVVTPSNPFGVPPGSSSRPGVISPAPQGPPPPPSNTRQN